MEKPYILITGGTKGIGYAVARRLGEAGYSLVLTYATDDRRAEQVCRELKDLYSIDVHVFSADITSADSIESICSYIQDSGLCLNSIVFNAGLTNRDSFEQITWDDWNRVFYANIHFPVFLLQRFVANQLIETGGSVIFTGSLMGIQPHSVSLAYGVTKSAVHALVKNLVKFLIPYEIRVNGVVPGFVDTEWQKKKPREIRQNIEQKISLGRFCAPEEIAEVYKMLIENAYFNGELVVVDGGYSYK